MIGIKSYKYHRFEIGSPTPRRFEIRTTADELPPVLTPNRIEYGRNFDPVNVMYIGRRGRGKTQGMTYFQGWTRYLIEKYNQRCQPNKILGNYWSAYADVLDENLLDWLNEDGAFDPRARNAHIDVDEIGSQVANRRSLARGNLDFAQILTQIRKLQTEMGFTTQFPQWVDMMALYQTDIFNMMDGYSFDEDGMPQKIEVYQWDYFGQYTGDFRRKYWPPQMQDVNWNFTILNATVVKGKYKTNQIIPPAWWKGGRRKQVILNEWGESVDADEYGFDGDFAADVKQVMELAPAQTIAELLDRQNAEGFSYKALHAQAKRINPDIKNYKMWIAELQAHGWTVEGDTAHKAG